MILAAIGLFLSIIVHVSALLGMPCPFGDKTWTLHIGIFVVWFPAVLASQRLAKDFKRKDFWKATLRACPLWMKWMTYFFFAYAILNFIIFILTDVGGGGSSGSDGDTQSTVFRGFSGHWMAFYSASLAILYSADHVRKHLTVTDFGEGLTTEHQYSYTRGEK